jgi:hypothetical protein
MAPQKLIARRQECLTARLVEHGIDKESIRAVIDSGYFYTEIQLDWSSKTIPGVKDSYYGNKASGLFSLEEFVAHLKGSPLHKPPSDVPEYCIRSLAHACKVLSSPRHVRYCEGMSFRGQPKDYMVRRPMPNPRLKDNLGAERVILPSWWRSSLNKNPSVREYELERSVFVTPEFAESLVFEGLPNWQEHAMQHKLSMADNYNDDEFPDETCREIWHRYNTHFIEGPVSNEIPLIEQHYGIPTIGLDVTFDLATALFFAAHRFHQPYDGLASFVPVDGKAHEGVVYCFVFSSPPVRRTSEQIARLRAFAHIPPLRPVRQQCALPAFHIDEISAACRDLDAILHLGQDFDPDGLPTMKSLFPGPDEDQFYRALLDQKQKVGGEWNQFIEYKR